MTTPGRPPFIGHWRDLEQADDSHYDQDDELMSIGAPLGRLFGLTRIGVHHERLPPGRRTSFPHAERTEEEFVYVLEGTPDAWIDGVLHPLKPGDAVGFPAGTGISHTFINNSDAEVRLLVIGEKRPEDNTFFYPLHPERPLEREFFWEGHPQHDLGPHDGMPDVVREKKAGLPG